jgi:hypothetical protein
MKKFGVSINWNNPVNLNEKINWLAFNTDNALWTTLADKYRVRRYVEEKGLNYILPKLYGVWTNVKKIDFDSLPVQFVLKCNHDAGSVFIIDNKDNNKFIDVKREISERLSITFGIATAEPHYKKIKKVIFAEEYLKNDSLISSSLIDYKFWSFNGIIDYCHVCYNTNVYEQKRSVIYNVHEWKMEKEKMLYPDSKSNIINIPKPITLNEMLFVAQTLSKGIPECRVDLYESNGKVYFGEMTFMSACGRISNYTESFLVELGNKIVLP